MDGGQLHPGSLSAEDTSDRVAALWLLQFVDILCIPCSFPSPFPVLALCGARRAISRLRRIQQHVETTLKITRSVQREGELHKSS